MRAAAQQESAAQEGAAAAGDSITVAAWTIVSRATGVLKFACIGAVLGPTFFGNTYQFTNSLPNLVYYGFLAGSLFSSLLVPALVRHIDAGDRRASQRVAGGFLGMTLVALVVIAPLAIVLGPLVLRVAAVSGTSSQLVGAAQAEVGRLLIIMFIPQIFFYGVVGTATAVMNSRQRFALAAGAPAVENLGTIAVLVATALIYGTGTRLGNIPPGELLLLGLGSTGAVAAHAATQWWGARRAGVTLMPRAGWRDPEVRVVIHRALPSLAQAGLMAFQVLTLLVVANRLPGGVVAFQIALNFYYLAIAVGATPVALSLLPRLARMHLDGDEAAFHDTLVRGLSLGFFITIPAAVGYLVLAVPLASAISFGRMRWCRRRGHGRCLAGGAVGSGRRPDRVHDRDLRVLRQEGHTFPADLHDAAGRRLPGCGQHRPARPWPDGAPRARHGALGRGVRRRLPSDRARVAEFRPARVAAARALAGQVPGGCRPHGRSRMAHRHGDPALDGQAVRPPDRHPRRRCGRPGGVPGRAGHMAHPRAGLARWGPRPPAGQGQEQGGGGSGPASRNRACGAAGERRPALGGRIPGPAG